MSNKSLKICAVLFLFLLYSFQVIASGQEQIDDLEKRVVSMERKLGINEENWSKIESDISRGTFFNSEARFGFSNREISGPGKAFATDHSGRGILVDDKGELVFAPYLNNSRQVFRWINVNGRMKPIDSIWTEFSLRVNSSTGYTGLVVKPQRVVLGYTDDSYSIRLGDFLLKWDPLILERKDNILSDLPGIWEQQLKAEQLDLGMQKGYWSLKGFQITKSAINGSMELFGSKLLQAKPLVQKSDTELLPGIYNRYIYGGKYNKEIGELSFEGSYLRLMDDISSLSPSQVGRNPDGSLLNKPMENRITTFGVSTAFSRIEGNVAVSMSTYLLDLTDKSSKMSGDARRIQLNIPFENIKAQYSYCYVSPNYIAYPAQSHGALKYNYPIFIKEGVNWVNSGRFEQNNYFQPPELFLHTQFDPREDLPITVTNDMGTKFMPYGQATPNRVGSEIKVALTIFKNSNLTVLLNQVREVVASQGATKAMVEGKVKIFLPLTDVVSLSLLRGCERVSNGVNFGQSNRFDIAAACKLTGDFYLGIGNTQFSLTGENLYQAGEFNKKKDIFNIGLYSDILFGGQVGLNLVKMSHKDLVDPNKNYFSNEVWLNIQFAK